MNLNIHNRRYWPATSTAGASPLDLQPEEPVFSDHRLYVLVTDTAGLQAAGHGKKAIAVEISAITAEPEMEGQERHPATHVFLALHYSEHLAASAGARLANITLQALNVLRQMAPEEITAKVEQLEAENNLADAAGDDELYQVLTAKEMADRMKLTPPVVYQRETAGELFSVLEPYRKSGRLFPAFQLNKKLNHRLLVKVIKAYSDADVNTTLLWSFLRSPARIFGGLTPIEMLLGGMPPAYEGLKPEERAAAILDVVAEELSRVRYQ
jgi:type III secretory pathway component EscV